VGGGIWVLDGQLDAVGGTELATALRRIEKELFEADWAEAKKTHGDKVCLDHLTRTPAQRRADALVELARRAMAASKHRKDPRPLFVVHLGDDSLKRMCELASGTVIAPGQLIPLLSEAEIERIVYAGPSRKVVDLGRKNRFFCKALRRAIQLRDRRCVNLGCTIRPMSAMSITTPSPGSTVAAPTRTTAPVAAPATTDPGRL
jgi:hypothetical protein